MGLKVSGQVNAQGLPFDLGQIGSFPGGVRGTSEAGHVRASEGGFIDLIPNIILNPKAPIVVKHILKQVDRRDIGVSVGTGVPRNKPELIQVPSIPKVRQPIRTGAIKEPAQIIGQAKAPNKFIIPPSILVPPKLSPRILNPPTIAPSKTKGVLDVLIDIIKPKPIIPIIKETPVALDLGNLLNVGLQAYQSYNTAKVQPVYDPRGFLPWSDVPLDQSIPVGPGIGVAAGSCLPAGYKYDKCGNVVKTRRRRRKRLATTSDIRDLAALSSVTTGAEKKTWIATHPS